MIDIATAPYGALILRLSLGIMFVAHGMLKVRVFTIPGTVAFFKTVGLPAWHLLPSAAARFTQRPPSERGLLVGYFATPKSTN